MAGFKKAILTNRDVNALNKARLSLQRPLDRALLGLFMYRPEGLRRVSGAPAATIQSLAAMPHVRETLASQWEAALQPVYPELDLIHALAVLHWWDAQTGLEVRKWAAAIGYWVTVVFHPHLGRLLPGADEAVLSAVAEAVTGRLRATIEQNGQVHDGLHANAVASLDNLERETRAARALRALNIDEKGVALSSGPLALSRAGILESVRARLDGLYQRNRSLAIQEARGLLSIGALVELLIERADFEQAQARLDQMQASPAVDAQKVRVARARARHLCDAGNMMEALDHWRAAIVRTVRGAARAELLAEVSREVSGAAQRFGKDDLDGCVTLLDKAFSIVSNADVRVLLGNCLMRRAFHLVSDDVNELSVSDLRTRGEALMEQHRRAIADFERAVSLGFGQAQGHAGNARKALGVLQRKVRDAKAGRQAEQLSLFGDDGLTRGGECERSKSRPRLALAWEAALPTAGIDVSFSLSGKVLAVAHGGGTTLFDVASGDVSMRLNDDGCVQCVVFSAISDDYLFEGSSTGHAGLWSLEGTPRYRVIDESEDEVVGFALSGNWRSLAVLREGSDSLRVVSTVGRAVHDITTPASSYVTAVAAFHASDRWVLGLGTALGLCGTYSRVCRDITEIGIFVKCLAVSPDERLIAVGGLMGEIALVQARDLRVKRVINVHAQCVNALAFSPDGALLISGGIGEKVKVLSVRSGRMIDCVSHDREVTGVAVSRDGEYAASVSFDNTVKVWRIER